MIPLGQKRLVFLYFQGKFYTILMTNFVIVSYFIVTILIKIKNL